MKTIHFLTILVVLFLCNNKIIAQSDWSGKVVYQSFGPDEKMRNRSSNQEMLFNNFESIQISNTKSNTPSAQNKAEGLTLSLAYGDSLGRQIYRNSNDKIIITRRPFNAISDAFIVKEEWIVVDWEVKNKTKMIGNYLATMATGSFRGRDYTVWFTYDIPVPFGPWKLHGLPGLILEAEDSEKMMRFYAKEILIPFNTKSIIKVPTAESQITHQAEVFMQDNFDNLLAQKINAKLPKGSRLTPVTKKDKRKFREEKNFEWEIEEKNEKKK
jgi:GLPGLI family protein